MIHLPDLFQRKLSSSPMLSEGVRRTFDLFEPWLEQSGMPFFPGFTDHSPRHINDVLTTAASLISDPSHGLLVAEDVAVLCMSILLHDCGMHLTQDMFRELISDDSPPLIQGLGDISWKTLWIDFAAEASRFGQDKLIAIFGDAQPLRLAEINFNDLGERDCLLIGEFVRRHHARLAHEIAIKGIRRSHGIPLELIGFDLELRNVAGLIARSHGMSIRSTFSYISSKYGLLQSFRSVKIPYLMAVLRIADYVQVKSERAIRTLLSVKELRSPVSRLEWNAHFSVSDVSSRHADPEALYVHANPLDVKLYLKLVYLFRDIQRELDESWSTLGEIYGRLGDLAVLGLSIRRIKSNLDNYDSFSRNVSYIPVKTGFDSSGPDLLKLLVGPLYDYEYDIGVRELVQNAVDACRELMDLSANRVDKIIPNPQVTVEMQESNDRTGWVVITDTGIGMTLDTIRKYFLIAGASFRNSDLWKKNHTDELGNVRVLRGGRFGIGALAAFLLGEQIVVTTRHVDRPETEGIEFSANMDDPIVELRRCTAVAGTTIRIWISDPEVFDSLRPTFYKNSSNENLLHSWDAAVWFRNDKPLVTYRWDGFCYPSNHPDKEQRSNDRAKFEYLLDSELAVPTLDGIKSPWVEISEPSPYRAIAWKYLSDSALGPDGKPYDGYPAWIDEVATVNGIYVDSYRFQDPVGHINLPKSEKFFGQSYFVQRPTLAIFDPAGVCPINLQRSAIAFDRMGFEEKLAESVVESHFQRVASLLKKAKSILDIHNVLKAMRRNAIVRYDGQVVPIVATQDGIYLASSSFFANPGLKTLFFIDIDAEFSDLDLRSVIKKTEALMIRITLEEPGIQSNVAWFRGIVSQALGDGYYSQLIGLPKLSSQSAFGLVKNKTWSMINEKGRIRRDLLQSLFSAECGNGRSIYASSVGMNPTENPLYKRMLELNSVISPGSELYAWEVISGDPLVAQGSLMQRAWDRVFGAPKIRIRAK